MVMYLLDRLHIVVIRYGDLVHLWVTRFEGKQKMALMDPVLLFQHHQQVLVINLYYNNLLAIVTFSTGTGM